MLSAMRVSSAWPKPLIASGMMTPLMRYWMFAWSPRTCSWPNESWTTPGACRTHLVQRRGFAERQVGEVLPLKR